MSAFLLAVDVEEMFPDCQWDATAATTILNLQQLVCKSNAAPISSNPGIWSLPPYGSNSRMLVFSVSAKARVFLVLWSLFAASD
jgi:hypothetical protein